MSKVTALGMDTITEKSGHQMTGMAVSVCTTPAAPSPVPIPYPTMGTVAEGITDPPMRTKINGAKILTVGGCLKACHGNEPGTLKEVVSLNTGGPCFPCLGAPNVLIELGMAGITGSMGQMNKSPGTGAGATAAVQAVRAARAVREAPDVLGRRAQAGRKRRATREGVAAGTTGALGRRIRRRRPAQRARPRRGIRST
ncbi:DUF4150 domain-containing protein [Sorangium sp. So ce1000]|uniref:DUF4150 domain-containing protein n=1 Tax=Sorangium sp. So ce1000 TaxID=3133325 RepID=UPI003F5D9428